MDCPACKNAMVTLELAEVEIDHCTSCGGIWLDAGELETLLGGGDPAADVIESLKPVAAPGQKARICPICRKKMEEVAAGEIPSGPFLDRCVRGHGLWFDRGELKDVLSGARLDADGRILNLLLEMFSRY